MCMGFPDTCKTPVGPVVVPIPYPNIGQVMMANPGTLATTILICGFPAATTNTELMMTQGDEAGVLGGVVSGIIMGPGKFTLGSATVKMSGMPPVYMGSMIGLNGTAAANCPAGCQIAPSQVMVQVAP
jgi:hypothetical protein